MKAGIAGWFGSDNLGDEILLHTLIHCVRSVRADASFVVLCPDPDRVAALHGVPATQLPTLRGDGAAERQQAARRAIGDCDILFLGPGTVFQERSPNLPWPGTLPLFARLISTARLAGTPVAPVGVGVREGGTAAGRRLLSLLGRACVAIGARDQQTAAQFGRRARVIGDLAYALGLPESGAAPPERTFALSMRPLGADTEPALLSALSGCVRRLRADGWSGAFLPMAFGRGARGEDDREIYQRAFAETLTLPGSPLDGDGPLAVPLDRWLATLGGYRLVIGTRLHAAVLAVALGVPTVAVAYERKVHQAFVDLGLDRFVVRPDVDVETLHRTALLAAGSPEEFGRAAERVAAQGLVARDFVGSVLAGLPG